MGKLPNYMWYFGSNNVEGVAESWLEVEGAGWSWVEVDARFNNTYVDLHLPSSALFPKIKWLESEIGLFGRLWLFADGLWSFADAFWSFAFFFWWLVVVCGRLLVVCGCLWSLPVLVTACVNAITVSWWIL